MPLTLDAAIDRPLVPADAPAERYLMLTLQAPAGPTRRLPLNLALVVDASGSMAGAKLARVKEAAGFVLRHLTGADRVAVVAYADEARVVAPSTLLTPQARNDLLYRLGRLEADGRTNLSGGWLTACQEVARHQHGADALRRVLLLTDGLANVGITSNTELVEHARQLRQRGVTTSTMGVGADFNEELLEGMARDGGGRFQYVETARHIPDCVQGELGEMLQVSARSAAAEVALPETVRCLGCLNEYSLEKTRRGVRLHLGDLLAGDTRRALLHLSVEPGPPGNPLPVGALSLYLDTATGHGTEEPFPPLAMRYADRAAVEDQATNDDVAREVALLLAARAKQEAVRLSRLGDHLAAASALADARRSLSAGAYMAHPAVASELATLASLAQAARQGLSEYQRKELRYQSYLTREARGRYDPPRPAGWWS
jgi:Ca-activated chloride channel family protein